MSISLFTPFFVSCVLALAAPWASRRLPPRLASWLLVVASLVAAGGWAAALAMPAFTLVGRIPLIAAEGRWSPGVLAAHSPIAPYLAAVCGAVLAACLVTGSVTACRRVGTLLGARRESRGLNAVDGLAVIDDPAPVAFALPGSPGRIIVSSGMFRALGPDERRALLAHERAHLHHRHHLFVLLLQVKAGVNPLLRRVSAAGAFALERWADEEAATTVADRRLVARAVARAALAAKQAPSPALALTGGPVPQRVQALLAPPPAVPRGLVVAHAVLMISCCVSLLLAARTMDQLFDAASTLHAAVAAQPR